jgi:dTDP-4-dehydrorhamnose reductase
MRILVTGVKGQLGHDVVKRLKELNIECRGVDIEDFDLTKLEELLTYIRSYSPDCVIHCAAYTAVDKAEEMRDTCYAVNVTGTRNIAEACRELDAKLIYISTDYVFDGLGEAPFETDTKPNPINYYGLTKYQGEIEAGKLVEKLFIVRISWAFGVNGNNFVKTMLRLGKERDELNVVADQIGSPTYTDDLAELLCDMIQTDKYGVYHATNEGLCSWYEFACEIFKLTGVSVKLHPIKTEEYPTRATRPKNSRLSKRSLDEAGFKRLPSWKDALERYITEICET